MEKSHFIDMGVNELLHELLTNENIQLGQIDIFNHIKRNTNNFDAESIFLMYNDLYGFLDNNVCMTFEGECYRLADFYEIKHSNLNDIPNLGLNNGVKLKEIIDSVDWVYNDARELELMRNFDLVYELYNKPGLELEYEIENIVEYVDDFEYELLKRKNDIKKFMGSGEWKLHNTSQNKFKSKQPLTFPGLFNDKYLEKIGDLIILLRKNDIIDETDELLLKGIDFARIFYYLIEIHVIKKKYLNRNDGIKAFFARFKVDVVEKIDDTTSQLTRSGVTNNDAKNFDQISDDYILKELEKLFL